MADGLITDQYLFPRSEYYNRFKGTTAFKMDTPDYWGTYHRSEGTRYFTEVGGRKNAAFVSPCAKKPLKANSFSAHTGGISSPFNNECYSEAITLEQKVSKSTTNVRDHLLHYKRQTAATVVSSFEKANKKNFQKISKQNKSLRPIVFQENGYPCVLVKLPALNPLETQAPSAEYWAKHPKPFQKLLLASFIALLNHNACEENIPIEIVIRSSFGHSLPSVCETDNTFRINVGLVPKAYAELMGKTLQELNKTITKLMEMPTLETEFDKKFRDNVHGYNATKLKKAIDSKPLYKKLRGTQEYENAKTSVSSFKKLYLSFLSSKENNKKKTGYANFIPVKLQSKTVWEVIQEAGDSMGKSILSECFRKNETVDWFANAVMDTLEEYEIDFSIELALQKLVGYLTYGDTVSMNYKKIHTDLKQSKRRFDCLSFKSFYEDDPAFNAITMKLFNAWCAKRPDTAMYSALEHAGVAFFSTYRGSDEVSESLDYGSDSEFSDNFSFDEESWVSESSEYEDSGSSDDSLGKKTEKDESSDTNKGAHFSHKKLRVCSGMKAIVLAQYAALSYLLKKGIKEFHKDVEQMYYEVEGAIKMVNVPNIKENSIRANAKGQILHYDLNYCNAASCANTKSLAKKLTAIKPSIVVLDYTSSTIAELTSAAKECFSQKQVEFVFLVHSGLKNGQGGLDFNPYGEIRLMARNSKLRDQIIKILKQGLAEQDKSSQEVHEMVRASKRRGLEISLFGFFKNNSRRFQPAEELDLTVAVPVN